MRRMLLFISAAILLLVPSVACVFAAFSSRPRRILPVGFWVLWLLLALWAMFYAPVAVNRLTSPHAANHRRGLAYARWGIVLSIVNILWSVLEIVWLE